MPRYSSDAVRSVIADARARFARLPRFMPDHVRAIHASGEVSAYVRMLDYFAASTSSEDFAVIVDCYLHGDLVGNILIEMLDHDTDRPDEKLIELWEHDGLRDDIEALPIAVRVATHRQIAATDWIHAAHLRSDPDKIEHLLTMTDPQRVARELDRMDVQGGRITLAQLHGIIRWLSEADRATVTSFWNNASRFPWVFRRNHWQTLIQWLQSQHVLDLEAADAALNAWQELRPLDAPNYWDERRKSERIGDHFGGGVRRSSAESRQWVNKVQHRIEVIEAAQSPKQLADAYFQWDFRLTHHTEVVPALIRAMTAHPSFNVELLVFLLHDAALNYPVEQRDRLRGLLEERAESVKNEVTGERWPIRLMGADPERLPLLPNMVMSIVLAVRKTRSTALLDYLWRYYEHYYAKHPQPMSEKIAQAIAANPATSAATREMAA